MDEDKLLERITINPKIFGGKPIIRGHRLAVEHSAHPRARRLRRSRAASEPRDAAGRRPGQTVRIPDPAGGAAGTRAESVVLLAGLRSVRDVRRAGPTRRDRRRPDAVLVCLDVTKAGADRNAPLLRYRPTPALMPR